MLVGASGFWRQKDRFPGKSLDFTGLLKGNKFHILWQSSPLYLGDKTKQYKTPEYPEKSIKYEWNKEKKKKGGGRGGKAGI